MSAGTVRSIGENDTTENRPDAEDSEIEQLTFQPAGEAERAEVRSAFSFAVVPITQEVVDNFLRVGSNRRTAKERIISACEKQKSIQDIAELLKEEYVGGYGIHDKSLDYAVWYAGDGIHAAMGRSARTSRRAQVISWETAAQRIGTMLENGTFANNRELARADGVVRSELAQSLLFLYHDLSGEARERNCLQSLSGFPGGYPEATAALAEKFTDPVFVETLRYDYAQFCEAYRKDRALLRFHYHKTEKLRQGLEELSLPQRTYTTHMDSLPEVSSFITEDELDALFADGGGIEGSKGRIYRYFTQPHTPQEKANFLKEEYGIGGKSPALIGENSSESHDSKGMKVTKANCADVPITWPKVAERISTLIRQNRYLTPEERGQLEQAQEKDVLEKYDIGYGYLGNGLTVWNRKEEEHGDYKTIAHIDSDRTVTFYEENLPDAVKAKIQRIADTETMTISATQDAPVFSAPPKAVPKPALPKQEIDDFSDIDPAAVRAILAERGIAGGRIVDPEKADASPFVRQVMADVERITAQEEQAEVPDFSGQPITRKGDTITIGSNAATHEIDAAIPDEDWQAMQKAVPDATEPPRDPLAPAYRVGDTVYLDDKPFEITEVRDFSIQLKDVSSIYPIFRAENRESFEWLIQNDERNRSVTDFLAANLDSDDSDLQEVLAAEGGLLSFDEKAVISSRFSAGDGNTRVAQLLSEMAAGRAETIKLVTGETADCFPSDTGIEIHILDDAENKKAAMSYPWNRAAAVLRAMYQQERDGFSHAPVSSAPEMKVISAEQVAAADQPATAEQAASAPTFRTTTTAVYPAEPNHMPFDVVVEKLHMNEPERARPGQTKEPPAQPPAENFRITDDTLGAGGAKEKFWRNIKAIGALKQIEDEGRSATPEEQHILSQYVGWGGLADAFDDTKSSWAAEYEELRSVLSPEEYTAARASTLNAHYTTPTVIREIYGTVERMGFQNGNILEPSMGIGNFFGCLPESMAASKLYGVELDSITGRIAKQLYPDANITVAGFETTNRRDFYDLAVGNVPFGNYQVNDRAYNKLGFSIHNYFLAKTIDQVRPGGIVAFVTSRYTMDAKNTDAREYIARRADLLGAVRLPCTAFKENAGTEVVTDILFLQKRSTAALSLPPWVETGTTIESFRMNQYFIDHPDMVLGTLSAESTMYGGQDLTVLPVGDVPLAQQLHSALQNIHGHYEPERAVLEEAIDETQQEETLPADPDVRNFSYTLKDGKLYFRENSVMTRVQKSAAAEGRIRALIELRDAARGLIDAQLADMPDEEIKRQQVRLSDLYDRYAAKHGRINSRAAIQAFQDDSSYPLLASLETFDEEGNFQGRSDLFTKRTIRAPRVPEHVDTAVEALGVSIGEKACVDMPYMERLTGKSEAELVEDLTGVIFRDPLKKQADGQPVYLAADEYLSGNVRQKLAMAEIAVKSDPTLHVNVQALQQVQPRELEASEISVRLGATWIEPDIIKRFADETLSVGPYMRDHIRIRFSPITGNWCVEGKSWGHGNVRAEDVYGTKRANFYDILEDSLNMRATRIFDKIVDVDGSERRVLNTEETQAAQEKQSRIEEAFREWIWKDQTRRQYLVKLYNEKFNSIRPREYDGSHIQFVGMNPEIAMRQHQKNAVAHALYGGNTLLAHVVGAGKSYEMIAAAMERKRLGLCTKTLICVPNHLTEQMAADAQKLYPNAKVLVARQRDFEKKRRKQFCARIATGDYDIVILGHSQLERIPLSQERQQEYLERQIDELIEQITAAKMESGSRFTVKQMERARRQYEVKLKKLIDAPQRDDVVTFEELGIDSLMIDEAQNFKNLSVVSKMRNVAGVSQTEAQKSSDLYMKCQYLDEITGGRGCVFATGTPVSNSMTEMYVMMCYLQSHLLKEKDLSAFDAWASTFGETVTAIELAPEGTGYRTKTRFSRFYNLPELMAMFKEAADIQTADMLHLPVPAMKNGAPIDVKLTPSAEQKELLKELGERADKVRKGEVRPEEDNLLAITGDGRKLALDQRLLDPSLPDDPASKVNACVENVYRVWDATKEKRLTQIVFCDLSTPGTGRFNVYDDMKGKLTGRGVPEDEIAFIHDADSEQKKAALFAKVRAGTVRILMGSTAKMGTGTNVQTRLVALHHLDVPWRPADIEQRNGRILRQGNENREVSIYRYVTESTFDAYSWQIIENKQRFISQIMTSKSPVRSCEDMDEAALSYAEIKALAAGNPMIKEKMNLDIEVSRLRSLKASYDSQRFRLEDALTLRLPADLNEKQVLVRACQKDVETAAAHPQKDGDFSIELGGNFYTKREDAGKVLLGMLGEAVRTQEAVSIGRYCGLEVRVCYRSMEKEFAVQLAGESVHSAPLGTDAVGNMMRIRNLAQDLPKKLEKLKNEVREIEKSMDDAREELKQPFRQAEELKTKSERLNVLNALLNIDGKDKVIDTQSDVEVNAQKRRKGPAHDSREER